MATRILFVVASGPSAETRGLEGLHLAVATHRTGMVDAVEVLLTGEAVRCLDGDDAACERLGEALDDLLEAEVPVSACTRSLAEHRLVDAAEARPEVAPVGAPTFLSDRAIARWVMFTF